MRRVTEAISEHEGSVIEQQRQRYSDWLLVRERLVGEQIEELKREKRKEEIIERLGQLQHTQERLEYFEFFKPARFQHRADFIYMLNYQYVTLKIDKR